MSRLCNTEKILEKLVCKRVYQFLTENNIIYDLHFGFRQNYSTAHVLIILTLKVLDRLLMKDTSDIEYF